MEFMLEDLRINQYG